jgi:hypothetical protein
MGSLAWALSPRPRKSIASIRRLPPSKFATGSKSRALRVSPGMQTSGARDAGPG